jgi:hypothetical protein
MSTFLLTWNPARWTWENLAEVAQQTARGVPYATRWSTGNTKRIIRGDRVFLLKQGAEPRGIIAAGWVTSEEVYEAPHYDPQRAAHGDTALRADVEFERILDPSEAIPLSVEDIEYGPLAEVNWHTPASGPQIPDDAAGELEAMWARHLAAIDGPVYLDAGEAESPLRGEWAEAPFVPEAGDSRAVAFRQIRARRGQQAFRDALRQRYGSRCMITGCELMDLVEAAHVKPFRGAADNHPANGLLLRADLHTLFDLDLIGIEPGTLIVRVHPYAGAAGYGGFDGVKLKCSSREPSRDALALRWEVFQRRRQSGGSC